MKDKEIWDGVRKGDYASLKHLYDSYFDVLYSYGLKISRDSEQTMDSIHDLFLDLWKYREKLSDTTSIQFYLFRALRRKIYKNQIKESKSSKVEENWIDRSFEISNEEVLISREQKSETNLKLENQLNELPDRQKEAIMLKFYTDLSYKEISEIMEVNEQSARNLVQRGLENLRFSLKVIVFVFLNFF